MSEQEKSAIQAKRHDYVTAGEIDEAYSVASMAKKRDYYYNMAITFPTDIKQYFQLHLDFADCIRALVGSAI